jgi:hypothetical protein
MERAGRLRAKERFFRPSDEAGVLPDDAFCHFGTRKKKTSRAYRAQLEPIEAGGVYV